MRSQIVVVVAVAVLVFISRVRMSFPMPSIDYVPAKKVKINSDQNASSFHLQEP